jgi:hypothetical protein
MNPLQRRFSHLVHNWGMYRLLTTTLCAAGFGLWATPASFAQDAEPAAAQDAAGRSAEVEESDEEYRRRMELEDARQRNLGYTLPPESYVAQQDKLDKLPEPSRDNVRDQLVDIIVENGEWEPSDALKEYPYEPTAAALEDPDLLEMEQAAWDEQIDKYHKREAAAFGTYLGPVPGPGNPSGAEGGAQAQAGEGAEGSGPAGAQPGSAGEMEGGSQGGQAGSAGTYSPASSSQAGSGEEISTAGVRQSALDFLKAQQGQVGSQASTPMATSAAGMPAASGPAGSGQAASEVPVESARQQAGMPEPAATDEPAGEATDIDLTTPGIIPIEDLEKLEGADGTDGAEPRR